MTEPAERAQTAPELRAEIRRLKRICKAQRTLIHAYKTGAMRGVERALDALAKDRRSDD